MSGNPIITHGTDLYFINVFINVKQCANQLFQLHDSIETVSGTLKGGLQHQEAEVVEREAGNQETASRQKSVFWLNPACYG